MQRKESLVTGEYYHVFNKSIAKFRIFNTRVEFERMIMGIRYYQIQKPACSLAQFLQRNDISGLPKQARKVVRVIAYCIMPTHVHLLLQQLDENGIAIFMRLWQGSYATYFNIKYKRQGPLWAGRFKGVLVKDSDQLLHLTRYIHLNPTTAGLVTNPLEWSFSSYQEYVARERILDSVVDGERFDLTPDEYKNFVEESIQYQQELGLARYLSSLEDGG